MIEAVIWDFGGVFTTSPFEAFARYERERGIPVGVIRKINSTNHEHNAWAMFERSAIDFAGFDAAFAAEARMLGYEIPGTRRCRAAGRRLPARDDRSAPPHQVQVQDRLHHQQHAGRRGRRHCHQPLDLFARDHGTVRRTDRILEDRNPQTRSAHLYDDVRKARRRHPTPASISTTSAAISNPRARWA